MKIFKINDELSVICESKKTRNGFKHEATLMRSGYEEERVKICYLNRTWERYDFESVLEKLCDKSSITDEERALFTERIKTNWLEDEEREVNANFGIVATIAKLGNVFHAGDKKAANDWKTRMLKAGLEGLGLTMPDDWDTLSEDEKERRLNGAIDSLKV